VRPRFAMLGSVIAVLLLTASLSATAQQSERVYRIGILDTIGASVNAENLQAFRQELSARGYVEGRNLSIEYRSAEGKAERFPDLAAELVRLRVDIIVTRGTPAAIAAKNATATIAIVMASAGDPIGTGLVPNLAHPGGNLTGLSSVVAELSGKRIELLRAAFPTFSRVGVLWNPISLAAQAEWKAIDAAAPAFGVVASSLEVRKSEDLEPAFTAMRKQRLDALVVELDPLTLHHRKQIVALARRYRLPDIYASREFVEAGGLISYGVNYPDLYRRAAIYVDKILKGAKPADLPIEQPTKFELLINLKTAKALGLTIPPSLLARADQVIE
jgi:putative ABC transport system substrate-binding protein